ncbi:hypothetical protein D3C81_2072210 [compost metagenome]
MAIAMGPRMDSMVPTWHIQAAMTPRARDAIPRQLISPQELLEWWQYRESRSTLARRIRKKSTRVMPAQGPIQTTKNTIRFSKAWANSPDCRKQ